MNSPDYSKYNKTQLRRLLAHVDRERFPSRVMEIDAELSARTKDAAIARSGQLTTKWVGGVKFVVMPLPGGAMTVIGPALPFFAISIISFILKVIADPTKRHALLQITSTIGLMTLFIGFAVAHFRLKTITCPICQNKCKSTFIANQTWGAICEECEICWDTRVGLDDEAGDGE